MQLSQSDITLICAALRDYRASLNDELCGDDLLDDWADGELVRIEALRIRLRALEGAQ